MSPRHSKEALDTLFALYQDIEIPMQDIADFTGIARQYISKILRRHKYPITLRSNQYNTLMAKQSDDSRRLWFKEHAYKRRAKRKGILFNLTDKEFLSLVTSPCYYCGFYGETRSIRTFQIEMLTIDRLDSDKGYVFDNCVPACKQCNTIKMDYSVEDFKIKIKQIYNHLNLGELK